MEGAIRHRNKVRVGLEEVVRWEEGTLMTTGVIKSVRERECAAHNNNIIMREL